MPVELERTLLALGRLHRRRNARLLAQECLTEAVRTLEACGAAAWASVAREELSRARGRRGSEEEGRPGQHPRGDGQWPVRDVEGAVQRLLLRHLHAQLAGDGIAVERHHPSLVAGHPRDLAF